MSSITIGVDLGGTNLRVAVADESGRLLEKITLGTQISQGRDFVVDEMCTSIREVSKKFSKGHTLKGIGIGVPGIIELEKGMIRESPNLPGWDNYPVRDEIERRLGVAVILENDANAAALGEKWAGAARNYDSMCMLTLGTGVGGGIVMNGRIWHGMTGMAGELGHMTVYPDGQPCGCGNIGCLEQYASATAVKRMALAAISSGSASGLAQAMSETAEMSAKLVYQLAIQGDETAREIFEKVGVALGISLAGMINALNLPIYVVGGGVSSAWEMFSPAMIREIRKRSFTFEATSPEGSHDAKRTIVTRAVLGTDAGLIGAARLPYLVVGADQN